MTNTSYTLILYDPVLDMELSLSTYDSLEDAREMEKLLTPSLIYGAKLFVSQVARNKDIVTLVLDLSAYSVLKEK